MSSYPAYHTGYETFSLVEQHIDPQFKIHQSCSRLISVLMYSLSSSTLIPIRLDELSNIILEDYAREGLSELLRKRLPKDHHASVDLMETTMKQFANESTKWHQHVEQVTNSTELKRDIYTIRHINDVAMRVERVFTQNAGRSLFKRPDTRNLLLGTPLDDFYSTLIFPGLHDLLNEIQYKESSKTRLVRMSHEELKLVQQEQKYLQLELRRHLSDIAIAFQVATRMLKQKPI